jgi:hypothetical protein
MNYTEREEMLKILSEAHFRAFDKYYEPEFNKIIKRIDKFEDHLKILESDLKKLQSQ